MIKRGWPADPRARDVALYGYEAARRIVLACEGSGHQPLAVNQTRWAMDEALLLYPDLCPTRKVKQWVSEERARRAAAVEREAKREAEWKARNEAAMREWRSPEAVAKRAADEAARNTPEAIAAREAKRNAEAKIRYKLVPGGVR